MNLVEGPSSWLGCQLLGDDYITKIIKKKKKNSLSHVFLALVGESRLTWILM